MEIHHSYVPLCFLEDFDKNAPAVPEQAARGPKHTPLLPYITSYLPPKNQDHSMSRSKDFNPQAPDLFLRLK